MSFYVQNRDQQEKNKSVENKDTRWKGMGTEKVTAILLQNLDESANNENENTKNDSQKEY